MKAFRVWAPEANEVELVLDESKIRHTMKAVSGGWFESDIDTNAGTDYWYSIDGRDPVPDPRSMSQPRGVHGPSRTVDHDAFEWTDTSWHGINFRSAVMYEMHIGTFTAEGTFASAEAMLDHLIGLGVTAIELLPVVEFPGDRGWGYDGVDLFAPHHAYGGPDGLKHFVDTCHGKGLAVILDVVYNHLGPDGDYLDSVGQYFTDRYVTPWGKAVNYDGVGSDEVRSFVLDNATMWLRDYHFDGLRLDAVHAIFDISATHILEKLAHEIDLLSIHLGRELFIIAESDLNDPRVIHGRDAGGLGMHAQWNDDFHHALQQTLTGEVDGYYADYDGLRALAVSLQENFVFSGQFSKHRGHAHGTSAKALPSWHFIGYLQNHDQVGNRAFGERTSALMSHGRLKVGAAILLLSPFLPMLFQGEEWGAATPFRYFTDHRDVELAKSVTEGRRREFKGGDWGADDIPDPQDDATFLDSKLNWDELNHPSHSDMLEWHRALIALRHSESALTDGGETLEVTTHGDVLEMRRASIVVIANLGEEPVEFVRPETVLVLASQPEVTHEVGTLRLPIDSVAILRGG